MRSLVIAITLFFGLPLVHAHSEGKHEDGEDGVVMASNALWKAECSSCHIAYPPQFLSARSWQSLMSNLTQHFGVDASLAPEAEKEITQFLIKNATGRRAENAPNDLAPRITETAWFQREHRKSKNKGHFSLPKVKSPANCIACHRGADKGQRFDEDTVSIPR